MSSDTTSNMLNESESAVASVDNVTKIKDTKNASVSVEPTVSRGGTMEIEEVYNLAREFVRDKEGSKAVILSYNDRNLMNVLSKQINSKKLEDEQNKVGFLDLVGKDRIQLWKSLGDLSKEDAMEKYIELITRICPLFHAHFEAHKRNLEEMEQKRLKQIEEEEQLRKEMTEQKEKKLREEDIKLLEENKKRREEIQRKQIQEALNQQTFPHFKAYAEQQHPNKTEAQEELIKQLQEQHFEQYMNQVYQQQLIHQQQQAEQLRAMRRAQKKNEVVLPDGEQFKELSLHPSHESSLDSVGQTLINLSPPEQNEQTPNLQLNNNTSTLQISEVDLSMTNDNFQEQHKMNEVNLNENTRNDSEENGADEETEELPPISAASMLTRKDIKEFKESVKKDNDAIIKVGSGETVTVRVPTHEDGRLIFWEFSTDFYDLGFGLYFEWTLSPSNNVTVHVSDSSDEEEGEGEEDGDESNKQDVEVGDKVAENKPPCDEIIPIFRRDCHEEVYAGSHLYPGRGVYLLKFDNSYSLWRSKTLYYRVYYSK